MPVDQALLQRIQIDDISLTHADLSLLIDPFSKLQNELQETYRRRWPGGYVNNRGYGNEKIKRDIDHQYEQDRKQLLQEFNSEIDQIIQALNTNTNLIVLDLSQRPLTNVQANMLFKALQNNSSLQCLYLNGCQLSSQAAITLANFIQDHPSLTTLGLYTNKFDNGMNSIVNALKTNFRITRIDTNNKNTELQHLLDRNIKTIENAAKNPTPGENLLKEQQKLIQQQSTVIGNLQSQMVQSQLQIAQLTAMMNQMMSQLANQKNEDPSSSSDAKNKTSPRIFGRQ